MRLEPCAPLVRLEKIEGVRIVVVLADQKGDDKWFSRGRPLLIGLDALEEFGAALRFDMDGHTKAVVLSREIRQSCCSSALHKFLVKLNLRFGAAKTESGQVSERAYSAMREMNINMFVPQRISRYELFPSGEVRRLCVCLEALAAFVRLIKVERVGSLLVLAKQVAYGKGLCTKACMSGSVV